MSIETEPALTDTDREQWRRHVASERAWLTKGVGLPLCQAIVAVAERMTWLESECEHLRARADHATAELLTLGRELRQVRAALAEKGELPHG